MPRGGKRPGAGAPKGNLNAVKDGEYSKQMAIALYGGSLKDWEQFLARTRQVTDKRSAARQPKAVVHRPVEGSSERSAR